MEEKKRGRPKKENNIEKKEPIKVETRGRKPTGKKMKQVAFKIEASLYDEIEKIAQERASISIHTFLKDNIKDFYDFSLSNKNSKASGTFVYYPSETILKRIKFINDTQRINTTLENIISESINEETFRLVIKKMIENLEFESFANNLETEIKIFIPKFIVNQKTTLKINSDVGYNFIDTLQFAFTVENNLKNLDEMFNSLYNSLEAEKTIKKNTVEQTAVILKKFFELKSSLKNILEFEEDKSLKVSLEELNIFLEPLISQFLEMKKYYGI